MTINQEYYGFTPNKYVTSGAAGGGVGSVGDPWTLAEAMTSAVAGDIVGIAAGVYVGITTNGRENAAFRPTNSGTSGNPIRFVAQWAAASNTSNVTDLRCGNTTATNGCPAFGTNGKDYIEWVGILSDNNESNNQAFNAGTTPSGSSLAGLWNGDYAKVYGCKLVGDAVNPPTDNYSGVRLENGDNCEIYENIISGFIGNVNRTAIMTYGNQFTKIYNNEIFDCEHGIQPKGTGGVKDIIGLEVYKNKVYNCSEFMRTHGPVIGPSSELSKIYQNIVYDCDAIFEFTSSGSHVGEPSGLRVFNNVFYNITGFPSSIYQSDGLDWRTDDGVDPRDNEFFNNILSGGQAYCGGDHTYPEIYYYFGIINPDRNVVHNYNKIINAENGANLDSTTWSAWQTAGADVNSIQSDPLFFNPTSQDFTLTQSSPALTLGRDREGQFGAADATVPAGVYVTGSEVIGIGTSAINQLPAANYTPAKFTMEAVSPRPDAESDLSGGAYYRYYHADMTYRARVAVRGGAWPLHYELTTAPARATIGNNYGDADYGVISWASPTGASETFTVTVTDQEGATLAVTWTATLNESKFVFVDADVAGPGTGTFADPLSDIDGILSGHANKIAVLRASASKYLPAGALAIGNTTYPSTLMGFPGESPIVDGANGRTNVNDTSADDLSIINIIYDGTVTTLSGHSHAIVASMNGGQGKRFLLWGCTFRNQNEGEGVLNDNPACLWFDGQATEREYVAVVDNVQEATSITPFLNTFDVKRLLVENNTIADIDLTVNYGGSNTIHVSIKDRTSYFTFRNNSIIAPSHAGVMVTIFQQNNDVNTTDQEVCWNTIVATSTFSSGLLDWNGQSGENTVVPNMYQYRNSIKAVNGGYCSSYNYFPTGAAPANPAYAVTVEDELWSNNGPSQYIIILNGSAGNDGTVDTDLKYTFGAVAPVILDSSTEVDANGLLTGAARTTHIGLVGAEVAGSGVSLTVNIDSATLNMISQGDGTWKTSDPATSKIFQLAFDGSTPLHTSPETAYEGNGYITFYGDGNGNGTLGSNTNFDVVDISDDPLYGTVKGLRDTYYSSGTPVYSFTNQTAYISHNATRTFHMRMRIKWSGNWEWGSDQLKFCKNTGTNGLSANIPKFDGDGDAYVTFFPADLPADAFINAVVKEAPSPYRLVDDVVNDFGGLGVDANWSPTLGQWYTLDWFSDAGTFGNTDGSIKIWVDGNLYLQSENLDMKVTSSSGLYSDHQLGHVWQVGAPTQDIFMEWHDIQVFDTEQTPA